MAGRATSEEGDAFDDVTPAKSVSIYDLDEELPTRAQSSQEIAEFQQKAREKRDAAFRSFAPPTERTSSPSDPGSGSMPRPIPRESGPVRIDRLRLPPPIKTESKTEDLADVVSDVAATLERLPPAPRVPKFEPQRGSLETIAGVDETVAAPEPRRWLARLAIVVLLTIAAIFFALTILR